MKRSVLIVDDDARIRASLSRALSQQAGEVFTAESAEKAIASLSAVAPDVILSDVRMPGMSGLELLRLIRERAPSVDVVLMTAYDDLPTVAAAMREGAVDFLIKPLDLHQLRRVLDKVFEDRAARASTPQADEVDESRYEPDRLVGRDPRMVEIFKVVGQVSSTRATVIIRGESGTGKELIARAIHNGSPYASEPFVAVNCTALPSTLLESELFGHVKGSFTGATSDRRGRFALAGRGTVFLDEIGDTSLDFQSKLLRVLQEHEFYPVGAEHPERTEARIIAATHRDLERLVAKGEFREDLYYRLRVVEITVPTLRQRVGDIPLLAEYLVRKASQAVGREPPILARDTLDALLAHAWPGNVRELENCLTRAVVLATGDVIRPDHLGLTAQVAPVLAAPRMASLEQVEREHVAAVLKATRGHRARTARILGVSRPRLARLLKKYGIEDPSGTEPEPNEAVADPPDEG
ncbi:MAG: sigma-54-dependent Fis family transcriptional regulator [Gemmatimonadetes bacterium]|nr:sigma-54-dependent Fis family transcriptional regulator [Gemmatimonadota bacterium]